MTGVVLCGGQSTRMGRDKGLLLHQSATWAQRAVEKLQALQLPVVLSINPQQYETYSQLFQKPMLVIDDPNLNVGGPLKGILSVHAQQSQEDLLILACDMRDMKVDILEHLFTTYRHSDAEAMTFQNRDEIEPLCGVYAATGLHKLWKQYQHGVLKKFSLHYALQSLHTIYLPLPQAWENSFANFNSAADLDAL